jgi:prepilin-type N-terminal cleavage/methylation domain-containing protein
MKISNFKFQILYRTISYLREFKFKNKKQKIFKFCNSRSAGFTLLEIMIALAIIGIVVITIFNTVNYHSTLAFKNTLTTRMLLMAKEKLSETEQNPGNQKGVFPGKEFSYETTVQRFTGTGNQEVNDILEIKAIVRGHGREIELISLVPEKQQNQENEN